MISDRDTTTRVYGYFHNSEELLEYLNGRWSGSGIHGDPDVSPLSELALRMEAKGESLHLKFYEAKPVNTTSFFRGGFLSVFSRKSREERSAVLKPRRYKIVGGPREEIIFDFENPEAGSLEIEADFIRYSAGERVLSIQALDNRRLHLVMNHDEGRLIFSGALKR